VAEHAIERDGVVLSVSDDGSGAPVVLLHGLTATRRYVVMGSHALQRSGHRVIAYDARGHGRSTGAVDGVSYEYDDLTLDLGAVLDGRGVARAVLAGASMGAHTLLRLTLDAPDRVAGVVVITPGFDPDAHDDPARLAAWDALSDGLRDGGIDGFVAAYERERTIPAEWHETAIKVIRQRLVLHEHPDAVADALKVVPRSRPFSALGELSVLSVPAAVVASADGPDPEHPQTLGEAYADAIPGARLVLDEPGRSPVAWQGSQLSAVIAEVAARARL
jgi:pimeloyl-ACP methyl ester carboxylesterase